MAQGTDNPDASSPPPTLVVIRVFTSEMDATSAAALLRANDISAWLSADDCGGMLSALDAAQGVKLLVQSQDAEAAKALLAASPASASVQDVDTSSPPSNTAARPASNNLPIVSLVQIGAGVVGGILLCLLYQWADNLGVKTYRYDSDGDGRNDVAWVYRNGQCIELAEDRNSDGTLDSWVYYKDGYRFESATADDNFDGKLDAWSQYTNGLLVSVRLDTDFNGVPDVTSYFQHGQIIHCDWQPNGTNIVTLRQNFRHGVLFEEQRDTNWDGSFDLTIRYDAFLNPIVTNASR